MGTIASLVIKINGDISGLQSALGGASDAVAQTGEKLQGVGAKMTAGITLPIVGMGAAAISAAADQEQLQISFSTMLGSAEKATQLIDELNTFAASTPFQTTEVQNAAKMLIGYGVAAEDVTSTMTQLGDISAGLNVPIGDMAFLFGTAKAQGRLFSADINQFSTRGIPIIKALAATMGVAEGKVKGLVEEGKVGFPELQAAIGYLTEEGSQFGGLMEAQSTSINGMISTLKDNVELSMAAIGKVIIEQFDLKTKLASALEWTSQMKDALLDLAATNPQLFKMGVIIAAIAAVAGPALLAIGTAMTFLAPAVSGLGVALGLLAGPVGLAIAAIVALGLAWQFNVGGIQEKTAALAAQLPAAWAQIQATLAEAGKQFVLFGEEVQRTVAPIGEFVSAVVNAGRDLANGQTSISGFIEAVQTSFGSIDWTPITEKWDTLTAAVAAGVASVASYDYGTAVAGFRDAVVARFGSIDWMGAFNAAVSAANGLRDGAIAWLTGAIGSINWSGMSLDFAGFIGSIGAQLQAIDWSSINPLSMFMPLVGRLVPGLGPALSTAKWVVSSENFAALATSVRDAIFAIDWGAIGTALLGLVESVRLAIVGLDWTALATAGETIQAEIAALFAGIQMPALALPSIDMSGLTAGMQQVQTVLAPAFDRLNAALATLGPQLSSLMPLFTELGTAFGGLMTAMQPIATFLGQTLVVVASFGINTFAAIIQNLSGLVGPPINQVIAMFKLISTTITGVVAFVSAVIAGDWAGAWAAAQSILGGFRTFFTSTITNVKSFAITVFSTLSTSITNTMSDMGVDVKGVMDTIQGWWNGAWEALKSGMQPLLDGVESVKTAIEEMKKGIEGFKEWIAGLSLPDPFSGIANSVGGIASGLQSGVAGFLGIGGKQLGTAYAHGGWSWVGEGGPELVRLPRGAQVVPARESKEMANQGGGITVVIQQATIRSEQDLWELAYALDEIRRRQRK